MTTAISPLQSANQRSLHLPVSPSLSDFGTEVLTYSSLSANAGGMVVDSTIDNAGGRWGLIASRSHLFIW
jgi:hypothetical protein